MANSTYTQRQSSFNGGELSPRLLGRTDFDKRSVGLQTCQNAIVLPGGGVTKRPGFRYINSVKTSSKLVELIPFEFSESQSYVLEFGDEYMRVYMDGGRVTSPDANTLLLLHADGADRSITFTDDGVTVHTVSANGNAQIDTDQYMFPTGSALFDGAGDYLSIPDHADWNFGADAFTIDFRVRFYANTGISTLWCQKDATGGDHIVLFVDHEEGKIHLQVTDTGAAVINESAAWTPSVDTWYHVALVRGWGGVADDWAICVEGAAIHTFTDAGVMPDHDQVVLIGGGVGTTYAFDYAAQHPAMTWAGTAAIATTASKFGDGSIKLDGNSDYIRFADHADWDIAAEANATVDMFVKHTDHVGTEHYICHAADGSNFWRLYQAHGSYMAFEVCTGATYHVSARGAEIADTDWHHVVGVNAADHFGLYVDGVQTGYAYHSTDRSVNGNMDIGEFPGAGSYFDGYVDNVRISHGNTFGVDPGAWVEDASGAAHGYGTVAGYIAPSTTHKWGNGSAYFDGSDDRIYFANHADWDLWNEANCTIDFWIKFADHTGSDDVLAQVQDANNYWELRHVHGTGWQLLVATGGVVRYTLTAAAAEITDTDWHHIAVVKAGNEFGIYKDGVQCVHQSTASVYAINGNLDIASFNGAAFFGGNLDELRITHANSFGAAPVVGLTDTIVVPTAAHTSDADTVLLMHFNYDAVTVPTAPNSADGVNDVLVLRADASDFYGWLDEIRVSDTARWTAAFTIPVSEYPGGGGGTTYELVTPYDYLDVAGIRTVQSADSLYMFHPSYPTQLLARTDHDNWTITEVDWAEPPWNAINATATTLDPAATTGVGVNLIASAPLFSANHVGAYFKLKNGYLKITAVTNSTTAVCTIKSDLDDHVATADWYQGAWDATQSYPSMGVFHEDRLVVLEGTHPLYVFLSETGNYENFGAVTAPVVDTDPCSFEIMARTQNKLQWIDAGKKLFLGSAAGEFWMTGETIDLPITPTSVLVRRETTYGGEDILPVTIGHYTFFIQKGAKRILAWGFSNDDDAYVGTDLNLLAEHLTKDFTIQKMQYAQSPNGIVWMPLSDGYLMGMTYLRDQKVVGFHLHDTGLGGIIESVAVIPGTYGDELWISVCRDLGGTDVRYIERMDPDFFGGTIAVGDGFYVDSGLEYLGAPGVAYTGLDHLEGEDVQVLADGVYVGTKTISSGGFTLTDAASSVIAGLGYNMNLKTMPANIDSDQGDTSNKLKRIVEVLAQVYETGDFQYGRDSSNLLDTSLPAAAGAVNTGDYLLDFNGEHAYDPSIYIRQPYPLPFTLLSLTTKVEMEDD